jgi:hypothetical protein
MNQTDCYALGLFTLMSESRFRYRLLEVWNG